MKKTIFIKNAIILTATGLLLRFIGVIFKVWLASKIGSEGIGLYQVVFSVYVFASTFATSGISTAVTRLCTNELANNNGKGVKKTLKICILLSLFIAVISVLILFFGAKLISKSVISDERAVLPIKVLAFSLPFMSICSCLRGYFIARRKAIPPSFSQIIEQIIRIVAVLTAVRLTFSKGTELCLAGVFLGDTLSEIAGCIILYVVYKFDSRKIEGNIKTNNLNLLKQIKEIALPITLGRYINSALRTGENILVPRLLKLNILAKKSALSQFGMIKGMALPLIFFPSTLLNSLSTLLIPELSEAKTIGQQQMVASTVGNVIKTTAVISYIFSAIFFVCGEEIGILIYKNEIVGYLIKILSPLVPLMYLDSICDGMLKGLNQQKFTFYTSIIDSSLRIIFCMFLLPKFGLYGFVAVMFFSNFFTGILNTGKLITVSKAKFVPFDVVFLPCVSAISSVCLVDLVVKRVFYSMTLVYIISVSILSIVVYLLIISKITDFDIKKYL